MFICEPCLNKNYKNFAIPFSHGRCDDVKLCADIPSRDLIPKESVSKTDLDR